MKPAMLTFKRAGLVSARGGGGGVERRLRSLLAAAITNARFTKPNKNVCTKQGLKCESTIGPQFDVGEPQKSCIAVVLKSGAVPGGRVCGSNTSPFNILEAWCATETAWAAAPVIAI